MSFRVVEGAVDKFWCSTDGSSTYYIGQLVAFSAASKAATAGTVVPLAVPAGAADTTNFQLIGGIVTGLSKRTPAVDTTYYTDYEAGVTTQANQLARDWVGAEGMYVKGDPQVLVEVELISPYSLIEGPIYNAAYKTAPTVVTSTAASTTGWTSAGTTGACDFTPVTLNCTAYCRTGANAGLYRVTTDTSTTAPAVTVAFPQDVAVGDTFVRVPLKQGLSYIYINTGMFIDCSATPATNYFSVIVKKLDLSTAGKESAQFRFAATHFDQARA